MELRLPSARAEPPALLRARRDAVRAALLLLLQRLPRWQKAAAAPAKGASREGFVHGDEGFVWAGTAVYKPDEEARFHASRRALSDAEVAVLRHGPMAVPAAAVAAASADAAQDLGRILCDPEASCVENALKVLCCPLVAPLGLAFFALYALIKRGIPLLLRLLWRGLVGLCKLLLYTAVQLCKLLLYTAVKLCELLLGLLKLIGKLVGAVFLCLKHTWHGIVRCWHSFVETVLVPSKRCLFVTYDGIVQPMSRCVRFVLVAPLQKGATLLHAKVLAPAAACLGHAVGKVLEVAAKGVAAAFQGLRVGLMVVDGLLTEGVIWAFEALGRGVEALCNATAECFEALRRATAGCCAVLGRALEALCNATAECCAAVGRAVEALCNAIGRCCAAIGRAVTACCDWLDKHIVSPLGRAASAACELVGRGSAWVGTHVLTPLCNALGAAVNAVCDALGAALSAIGEAIVAVCAALGRAIAAVGKAIGALIAALCEALAAAGAAVGRALAAAAAAVGAAIGAVCVATGSVLAAIGEPIGRAIASAAAALGAVLASLVVATGRALAALGAALAAVAVGVGNTVGAVVDALARAAVASAQALVALFQRCDPAASGDGGRAGGAHDLV
eukprot:Transcript_7474.p2 GENE.Transcript_7474~~Transcript_7474.p2  ORF type:complete len:619 (-),score=227.16 Transcript_7474:54-1910(-)